MAQPLVLPALLSLLIQVRMEHATRQMSWKDRMKEVGDEGAQQPWLSAPGQAILPTPKSTSSAQGVSYRHHRPHSLRSASPASRIGTSDTFLILLDHSPPPPPLHLHSRAVGASPPSPGEFSCVRAP